MSNYLRELVEQERQAEQLSHNQARYREVSWFPAYKGMSCGSSLGYSTDHISKYPTGAGGGGADCEP